ncbi:hypothetical protein GY45DRAFT_1332344 [Cubamyces sp. BRFM 1775]|nr:hypothetical protein GY45DRAFT_1332344 [Cubamyces sp. BRFM 1775]
MDANPNVFSRRLKISYASLSASHVPMAAPVKLYDPNVDPARIPAHAGGHMKFSIPSRNPRACTPYTHLRAFLMCIVYLSARANTASFFSPSATIR